MRKLPEGSRTVRPPYAPHGASYAAWRYVKKVCWQRASRPGPGAFGLIDSYRIVEKSPMDDRMIALTITLSEWLYNAIVGRQVLTLSRDYFRLRKPLERRLYELARKHCGLQPAWKCSLTLLHKKSGTTSELREFRRLISEIATHQHLPDYEVVYEPEAASPEAVTFRLRALEQSTRTALAREHSTVDTIEREGEWRADWEAEHPGEVWPGQAAALRALRATTHSPPK